MLILSGESANECITRTRVYLKLAGWSNTAWIHRGMPEKTNKRNLIIKPVIHYNTLLYVLRV